ncbi:MAG: hypothetical protein AAF549_02490 [Pseudomonadota bacterium]
MRLLLTILISIFFSVSAQAEQAISLEGLQLPDSDHIAHIDFLEPESPISYNNDIFQESVSSDPNEWTMHLMKRQKSERIERDIQSKLLYVGFEYKFDN